MIKYLEKNDNLDELIKGKDVLIDFYADWCGPCQMMGKVLETIDFVDIIKINTDEFPEIAQKHGVMSIPTLIAFRNGEIISQSVGFQDADKIKEMFN